MKMLTFLPLEEIKEYEKLMNSKEYVPNTLQLRLAEEVTRFVHGANGLKQAIAGTKGLLPGSDTKLNIDVLESLVNVVPTALFPKAEVIDFPLVDVIVNVGLRASKGEVRRLINGGGVRVNNEKVVDSSYCISLSDLISGTMLLISIGKKNKFLLKVQ